MKPKFFGSKSILHLCASPQTFLTFSTGKIDAGRYPDVAESFHINTTALTRQLPTVILFENGKEAGRVPAIISGKVQKFVFKEEDIVHMFDLNNLYVKCKEDKRFAAKIKKEAGTTESKKEQ